MALSPLRAFRRPKQMDLEDYLKKLISKGLNKDGTPILDPTPLAPPIGYKKAPSMIDIVRDMVRGERLKQEALAAGFETFDEADDFDVDDEPVQLRSPHEFPEGDPSVRELLQAGKSLVEKKPSPDKKPEPAKGGPGGSQNKPPAPPAPPEPKPEPE